MEAKSVFQTLQDTMAKYKAAMGGGDNASKKSIQAALDAGSAALQSQDAGKASAAINQLNSIPTNIGNVKDSTYEEEDEGGMSRGSTAGEAKIDPIIDIGEGVGVKIPPINLPKKKEDGAPEEEPPPPPEETTPPAEEETPAPEETPEPPAQPEPEPPAGTVPEAEDPLDQQEEPEQEPPQPPQEPEAPPTNEAGVPEPTVENPEPEPAPPPEAPEPAVEEPTVENPEPEPPKNKYRIDGVITQNNRNYAWNIPTDVADIYYIWDAASKHTPGVPDDWLQSEEGKSWMQAHPTAVMPPDRGIIAVPKPGKEASPFLKAFKSGGEGTSEAGDPAAGDGGAGDAKAGDDCTAAVKAAKINYYVQSTGRGTTAAHFTLGGVQVWEKQDGPERAKGMLDKRGVAGVSNQDFSALLRQAIRPIPLSRGYGFKVKDPEAYKKVMQALGNNVPSDSRLKDIEDTEVPFERFNR